MRCVTIDSALKSEALTRDSRRCSDAKRAACTGAEIASKFGR
jgi:hypothetical protein